MFPELNSVQFARIDAELSKLADERSAQKRQDYIQAMRDKLGDDVIRHIHYDAMDAHNQAMACHNHMLGIRPYKLID